MPIDILFFISIAYGFWQGYNQGVISTIFNVVSYIFGITLAFKMTPTMTNIMEIVFHSQNPLMYLGAFVVNLMVIMFLLRMVARGLEKGFDAAYIGVLNQALGAMVLAGFYVLVCSIVVWFMVKAQFLNEATIKDSNTYQILEPLPAKAFDFAMRFKPLAEDAWGTSMNWMDRLQKYGDEKSKKAKEDESKAVKPKGSSIETDPNAGYNSTKTNYPPEDPDGIEE